MEGLANLGIDVWSLVLYLVNFGILVLILTKYLYKPILKVLDDRSKQIKENIEEAELLKKNFGEEMNKRIAKSEEVMKHMRLELEGTKRQADERAVVVLQQAKQERESLLVETQAHINEMKDRLVSDVRQELLANMEHIVVRVVHEQTSKEDLRASIERAWEDIQKTV